MIHDMLLNPCWQSACIFYSTVQNRERESQSKQHTRTHILTVTHTHIHTHTHTHTHTSTFSLSLSLCFSHACAHSLCVKWSLVVSISHGVKQHQCVMIMSVEFILFSCSCKSFVSMWYQNAAIWMWETCPLVWYVPPQGCIVRYATKKH